MAPEEMAGPRYRGLGMSRCAYEWGLKRSAQRKWCLTEVDVYPAASVLTRIYPKDECPSISITSRELK